MGIFGGQAVLAAFEMGLFTLLRERSQSVADIAASLGISERSAEALVLVCVACDLLQKEDERFRLTPMAEDYLLPESPLYYGNFLQGYVDQPMLTAYPSIRQAIIDGRSQVYEGGKLFETHEQEQRRARSFTLMMHSHSIAPGAAWPDKFDLSACRHMIDVGGGSGAHAMGAVTRWPALKATVFEIPAIQDIARDKISEFGLVDRIEVVVGDFWADPLPRGDLHFYGDIFHDWPDEKCAALAAKSFEAVEPNGRIMIHEVLYDDDKKGPFVAAAMTIVMLAWTEGKQRSGAELGQILEHAGFVDISVTPTFGYWSVVSGRKPT